MKSILSLNWFLHSVLKSQIVLTLISFLLLTSTYKKVYTDPKTCNLEINHFNACMKGYICNYFYSGMLQRFFLLENAHAHHNGWDWIFRSSNITEITKIKHSCKLHQGGKGSVQAIQYSHATHEIHSSVLWHRIQQWRLVSYFCRPLRVQRCIWWAEICLLMVITYPFLSKLSNEWSPFDSIYVPRNLIKIETVMYYLNSRKRRLVMIWLAFSTDRFMKRDKIRFRLGMN